MDVSQYFHETHAWLSTNIDLLLLMYVGTMFLLCGILFTLSPDREGLLDTAFTLREYVLAFWIAVVVLTSRVEYVQHQSGWIIPTLRLVVGVSTTLLFVGIARKVGVRLLYERLIHKKYGGKRAK